MSGIVATVLTVLAFAVLAGAVVSAFVPGVPTGAVSLAGVGLYWWGSGFTEPGTVVLVALAGLCLLTVAADWFGGVVAARVGGASTTTTLVAGGVGVVLLVVTGPVGMLLGSAFVVFALEYRTHRNARTGAMAAGTYVLGFFASAIVQAFLAVAVLVAVGWVAVF
ncbi:DUF456 domain-containing protein [Salinibaculum rarum]|uniref:DUF456 domain-containing protein n=1 Tax=Salinibaculum rarum TaxID=3058903 RepID=UPI00265E2859|nr:DUF456 domain-containing protein [Salinibaculum sp. KK48]